MGKSKYFSIHFNFSKRVSKIFPDNPVTRYTFTGRVITEFKSNQFFNQKQVFTYLISMKDHLERSFKSCSSRCSLEAVYI